MYNPSAPGVKGNLFGYPYSLEQADLVVVPVSNDVTVSYGEGTHQAPKNILSASTQLDLSLFSVEKPWEYPVALDQEVVDHDLNQIYRQKAKFVIEQIEIGEHPFQEAVEEVNLYTAEMHNNIYERCKEWLGKNKKVAVLGGDHSSPFGLIKALSEKKEFGILQIDAHMDLRYAYEGFFHSHASIMHNVLALENVKSLTQVGIRDYSKEELEFIDTSPKQIKVLYDREIYEFMQKGWTWKEIIEDIIQQLPDNVYVSFDIDGMEPPLCPGTGTPVPGGLRFNQVCYMLEELARQGKNIVGFDLSEVGSTEWDANVGARILYQLSVMVGLADKKIRFS
jgi:agmatinase